MSMSTCASVDGRKRRLVEIPGLTLEQFETIKTAVRLEYEKNYNT